jgi:hypothetical protein
VTPEFDEPRKQIDAAPARRANVEEHKTAMLGELRGVDEINEPRPGRRAEAGSDACDARTVGGCAVQDSEPAVSVKRRRSSSS